jgi:hypothetical protein
MSLAIDPDSVTHVLLADSEGWHEVDHGTFDLDAYEYVIAHEGPLESGDILHGGGQSGVCATGFTFRSGMYRVSGPLTAIVAVRTAAEETP